MADKIANQLFSEVASDIEHAASKVSVIGVGQVGMASAYAMIIQVM